MHNDFIYSRETNQSCCNIATCNRIYWCPSVCLLEFMRQCTWRKKSYMRHLQQWKKCES